MLRCSETFPAANLTHFVLFFLYHLYALSYKNDSTSVDESWLDYRINSLFHLCLYLGPFNLEKTCQFHSIVVLSVKSRIHESNSLICLFSLTLLPMSHISTGSLSPEHFVSSSVCPGSSHV